MLLRQTVAATTLPVPLRDAREHCRVTERDDDFLMDGMLRSAIEMIGEMAGRVLAPETWEMSIPFAAGTIKLPKSPIIAVTEIRYYDETGAVQTANVADFYLFQSDDYSFLQPKTAWPVASRRDDAITIKFTAGYGNIPPALRTAVLLMVAHMYEHREATTDGVLSNVPLGVETMVNLYRLGWIGG